MEDSYLTIGCESLAETKVKGSRFIAESVKALTVDEATEKLLAIKKREYSATHHCYAWRVGNEGTPQFKYSDDGEPSGSGGRPIFDVMSGRQLTNCLLVVTRYYGGTKLGTGGLARAYSDAARIVLEKSGDLTLYLKDSFRLSMEFPIYSQVQNLLASLGVDLIESDFSDRVRLDVAVRRSKSTELVDGFTELTQGRGKVEKIE
ncbi:MAG: YigZ family protein [candidate division Zixibacteria bacterium]